MSSLARHRANLWNVGAAIMAATILAGCARGGHRPQKTGAETHGLIYVAISGTARSRQVFVPGVAVYLKGLGNDIHSPKAVTNSWGWYDIPHMPAGNYQLCWEGEGFVASCTPPNQRIVIRNSLVSPVPQAIKPEPPIVVGRVAFASGRSCFAEDPALGLDTQAMVQLVDANGQPVGRSILANESGAFVVPKALAPSTASGPLRLRFECDGFKGEELLPKGGGVVNLTIKGSNPLITSLSVGDETPSVHRSRRGSVVIVRVAVKDATTRRLHYRWLPSDAGLGFVSQDSPTIRWPLPNYDALNTMQVLVTDEAGGHSTREIAVRSGPREVLFSGTVTDASGTILPGAKVSLNGESMITNGQGYFFFRLAEAPRYILNIRRDGYALFSRVLFKNIVGVRFILAKAEAFTVNPSQEVDVRQSLPSGRAGAELHLEPNSLVDANGRVPTKPVTIYLSTIDLKDPIGRLPGNGSGVNIADQPVRVGSYGGVDIQIRDSGGHPLNLARMRMALVLIPFVLANGAGQPPLTVPAWSYDEQAASWRQVGTSRLMGSVYATRVAHFSAINIGQASSNAACMVLNVDLGTLSFPFNLQVTVPQAAGGPPFVGTFPVTNAATDVLAELPPNEPIVLEVNSVPYSRQIINSGSATPGPANPNPAPGSCGSQANLAVALTPGLGGIPTPDETALNQLGAAGFLDFYGLDDQTSADAYYAAIDPTAVPGTGTVSSSGAAVTGTGTAFTSFFVPGDIIQAGGFTRTIANVTDDTHLTTFTDPAIAPPPSIPAGSSYSRVGTKTTLDRFKSVNHFTADKASAVYFNSNDLGFGRSMHMWQDGASILYYVTNYQDVESARLGIAPIATVAMEYSPGSGGGGPYTKFYVFNGSGARVNNANLDNNGIKFIPRLCVTCHGGTYVAPTTANQGNMGSRFIAFDLASYGYSGFSASFSRASQEEQFRLLNQGVFENTNPSAAQQELIQGWYGGAGGDDTVGRTVTDGFVPSGWTSHSTLYTDVVRTSCRTCHVDRDPPLDWNIFSGGALGSNNSGFKENGPLIEPYLCEIRLMPHALVTYVSFWSNSTSVSSPDRLSELQNAGLDGFLPSLACPLN